eukprot:190222-Hanusia_phi.AAC.2
MKEEEGKQGKMRERGEGREEGGIFHLSVPFVLESLLVLEKFQLPAILFRLQERYGRNGKGRELKRKQRAGEGGGEGGSRLRKGEEGVEG